MVSDEDRKSVRSDSQTFDSTTLYKWGFHGFAWTAERWKGQSLLTLVCTSWYWNDKKFHGGKHPEILSWRKWLHYAICFKEDNYPIGYVHVSNEDSRDFGYALAKKYWHQGITSEACLAFIDYLRACGFSYLTATHDVENPNSRRVMQKCGFHYCYTYQEQWQPKDKMVYFRMYQLNFKKDAEMFMGYWNRYPHFIETIEW